LTFFDHRFFAGFLAPGRDLALLLVAFFARLAAIRLSAFVTHVCPFPD